MRGSRFSPEFSSPVLETEQRIATDAIFVASKKVVPVDIR